MNGFISLLNQAHAIGELGLHLAIVAGFTASILALVVLALNLVGRRWLTSRQMGLLWGIVLLRMALPFAPPSHFSVQSGLLAVDKWMAGEPTSEANLYHVSDSPTRDVWVAESQYVATASEDGPPAIAQLTPATTPTVSWIESLINWLPLVWLGGALTVLSMTLFVHCRFILRLVRVTPTTDERLNALWEECCQQVRLMRRVPIIVCDEVSQPAVTGVLRPKLLLPTDTVELSDRQLRLIMLHEALHVRHWDVAVNWLLAFVRAMQWWNPCFWLALSRFGQLREQSRDTMVLRIVSGNDAGSASAAREYAELLLALAARSPRTGWKVVVPVSLLGILRGSAQKRAVAGRLRAMKRATARQRRTQRLAILGLVVCVAVAGLTDAAPPAEQNQPMDAYWSLKAGHLSINFSNDSQLFGELAPDVWESQEYDVTDAVVTITRHSDLSPQEALVEIRLDLLFHFSTSQIAFAELLDATRNEGTGAANPQGEAPQFAIRDENGRHFIEFTAPTTVHSRFAKALSAWEQSGLGQIIIEWRLLTSRGNVATEAGIDWDSIVSSPSSSGRGNERLSDRAPRPLSAVASVEEQVPMFLATLDDDETGCLVQLASSNPRSNMLMAPKVTLFNGQAGTIFSGVQRPFVVGLSTHENGHREPQIEFVNEGFQLDIAAVIAPDHSAIDLDSRLQLSGVIDVQTVTTRMDDGEEVTLQVPRVRQMRVETDMRIVDGHTLLIGLPPSYDREEFLFVLLTPRVLEPE